MMKVCLIAPPACRSEDVSLGDATPLQRVAEGVGGDPKGRLSAVGFAGKLRFDLELEPAAPAVGQMFRVHVDVRDLQTGKPFVGERYTLDATMPHHAHGMATRPSHRFVGPGRFSSEGLKFHMAGLWHFEASIEGRDAAGRPIADRVVVPFEQPLVVD